MNKVFSRLPTTAYEAGEIEQYYTTLSLQFLYDDFHWVKKIAHTSFGFLTAYIKEGEIYYNAFVHPTNQAAQLYSVWLTQVENKNFDIKEILELNSVQKQKFKLLKDSFKLVSTEGARDYQLVRAKDFYNCVLAQTVPQKNWTEYEAVQNFYGEQTATRSQVHLMNHIEEGLYILKSIKASTAAQKAYCLHPLYQNDTELTQFLKPHIVDKFSPMALALTLEYRSVANEYLSQRTISSIKDIRLSPLKEVNDMLVADKVQNYKDFSLYHAQTHARSRELETYFHNWFERLGVSQEFYNEMFFNLRHQHLLQGSLENNQNKSLKNFQI